MISEVEALAQRKGLQLSGGQQQLGALMCGTKLLLLDEPFEGVALLLCQRLVEVIGKLEHDGLSVILTESDLAHSRDMADRAFTIDRGEVVAKIAKEFPL